MCDVGKFTLGLNATSCLDSACTEANSFPSKAGATSATDGCITACPTGTTLALNPSGVEVCQSCPTQMTKNNTCVYSVDPSWKVVNSSLPFKKYGANVSKVGDN